MRVHEITLLGLLASASPLASQAPAAVDTTPVGVVQRFVNGANARDLALMMSAVAPDAVFAPLPDGAPLAVGRDSVQAFYRRVLSSLPATLRWWSRLASATAHSWSIASTSPTLASSGAITLPGSIR